MIVFSAIVPHTPLLAPTLGKDQRSKLEGTLNAFSYLEKQLALAKPETIILISPHAPKYSDAISINLHERYIGTLKRFGDHGTTLHAPADMLLIDRLQRGLRGADQPITLTSQEELDYGATVPLLLLTSRLQDWKLVPLAPSDMTGSQHVRFGEALAQILLSENRRIAVIASADLSHHSSPASPHGFTELGASFDTTVRQAVVARDSTPLVSLAPETAAAADQCGLMPILLWQGVMSTLSGSVRELCYEAPFGVGCFTALFEPGTHN